MKNEEFDFVEECKCDENEVEIRKNLEIKVVSDNELSISEELNGVFQQTQNLLPGQTLHRKPFDWLKSQGNGRVSICYCDTIGKKGTIFKPNGDSES